jgi:hypothetical protein
MYWRPVASGGTLYAGGVSGEHEESIGQRDGEMTHTAPVTCALEGGDDCTRREPPASDVDESVEDTHLDRDFAVPD